MDEPIQTTDALPNHMDGNKDAIDEGMKVFERKQKKRAKRKTWKWVTDERTIKQNRPNRRANNKRPSK